MICLENERIQSEPEKYVDHCRRQSDMLLDTSQSKLIKMASFFPRTYSDAMRRKIVNQWRSKNQSCGWNRILWVWVVYFTLDISVVHLCFLLWQMRICFRSHKRNSILIQKTYENFCLKPQYGIHRGSTFRQSSSLNFPFCRNSFIGVDCLPIVKCVDRYRLFLEALKCQE